MKQRLTKGLIQIYIGEGKGKTTAALGLAFRAMGHGFKVFVISFMKGGTYIGELYSAERFADRLEIVQFGRGCSNAALIKDGFADCSGCGDCFITKDNIELEDKTVINLGFKLSQEIIKKGQYDLVILDEICNAIEYDLLKVEQVVELLKNKPDHVELVLTGRQAPQELVESAHLVTEMKMIKHPFEIGVMGRRGIEY